MNFEERSNFEVSELIQFIKSDDNISRKKFCKELYSLLSKYISNPQPERIVFEKFLQVLYAENLKKQTKKSIFSHLQKTVESSPNLMDGFLNFLHYANSQKNSLANDLKKSLENWNWKILSDPSISHLQNYPSILYIDNYINGDFDRPIFSAIFKYISPEEIANSIFIKDFKIISSAFKNISQEARDNYADALLYYYTYNSNWEGLFEVLKKNSALKEVLPPSIFRIRNNYKIVDDCFKVTIKNIGKFSENLEYFSRSSQNICFAELFAASCLRCGKENLFSDSFLKEICFKKLSLNSYNGPFPYSEFLSVSKYVSYIDLKTFFAVAEKCLIVLSVYAKS